MIIIIIIFSSQVYNIICIFPFFRECYESCVFFLLVRTCVSYILCLCPVVYVSSFKIKVSALHIYFYSFKADVSVSSLVSFIDRWKGSSFFILCLYFSCIPYDPILSIVHTPTHLSSTLNDKMDAGQRELIFSKGELYLIFFVYVLLVRYVTILKKMVLCNEVVLKWP